MPAQQMIETLECDRYVGHCATTPPPHPRTASRLQGKAPPAATFLPRFRFFGIRPYLLTRFRCFLSSERNRYLGRCAAAPPSSRPRTASYLGNEASLAAA